MTSIDLAAVAELAGELVRLHHTFDPDRFLHLDRPEAGYARFLAGELEREEAILLVAEEAQGSVAGYAYARFEPRNYMDLLEACVKLHDLFVDARCRKSGIGEQLVREVMIRAEARGAPRVVLSTAAKNDSAQRFFARMGFATTMFEMTREL